MTSPRCGRSAGACSSGPGTRSTRPADGPEGIERSPASRTRWTGVLLDLTLPTLDGMAVLAAMRELRPDIPAVICSGWAAEEVSERLAVGAADADRREALCAVGARGCVRGAARTGARSRVARLAGRPQRIRRWIGRAPR